MFNPVQRKVSLSLIAQFADARTLPGTAGKSAERNSKSFIELVDKDMTEVGKLDDTASDLLPMTPGVVRRRTANDSTIQFLGDANTGRCLEIELSGKGTETHRFTGFTDTAVNQIAVYEQGDGGLGMMFARVERGSEKFTAERLQLSRGEVERLVTDGKIQWSLSK